MTNKSTKIVIILLIILFFSFIGAATYFLQDKNSQPAVSSDRLKSSDKPLLPEVSGIGPSSPEISPKTVAPPSRSGIMQDSRVANTEKPEPRQVPRQLTEKQKQENRRELAQMAEALPDNMWVPKDPATGFSPERGEKLRKSIELSDKIRKGTASIQEQQEYYSFKLKETTDKIELIRYIADRTEELSAQTGRQYLTRSDIDTGQERIEELERLAGEFEQKLSELDSAPAE